MPLEFSVITVNYLSGALIHGIECLLEDIPGARLIVIDNSGEFVTDHAKTTVLRPGRNLGFGAACNLGAEASSDPVLMFLNPDTTISRAQIVDLVARGSEGRNRIWGPVIEDGKGRYPKLDRPGRLGLMFRRGYHSELDLQQRELAALYVSGACMAIHSKLFQRLNGFSDRIFLYAEDLELCLRAEPFADVVLCADIRVAHAGGGSSSGKIHKLRRLRLSWKGHYAFLRLLGASPTKAAINALHLASGLRV